MKVTHSTLSSANTPLLPLDASHAFYRSERIHRTRELLFNAVMRGESSANYRFPSLNQWDGPLTEQSHDTRPFLREFGRNWVSGTTERAEEKSPRLLNSIPLKQRNGKMVSEEEKPKQLGDELHTCELRSLSTSEKKLREALGHISIQKEGIAKKKNCFSVRDQEIKEYDQKFRKVGFNPAKRVLVGQHKLRNTLHRAQSAEAMLERVSNISGVKRYEKESDYESEPPLLEVEAHNSKQRCRQGLQHLYRYVGSIRKIEDKKLPNIVDQESNQSDGKISEESDFSGCGDSSFQDSKLELSQDKEEDKMATQKSSNSDFSPTYYRHLSSLLSELEQHSPVRAGSDNKLAVQIPTLDLSQCRKRERSPSLGGESKMYQKWYKAQEEVEASESLILGYTLKLRRCEQL